MMMMVRLLRKSNTSLHLQLKVNFLSEISVLLIDEMAESRGNQDMPIFPVCQGRRFSNTDRRDCRVLRNDQESNNPGTKYDQTLHRKHRQHLLIQRRRCEKES